jgi:CIC family chloride channel protein
MAGGAVGMLVHRIAPFPTADPGAYALVGMGTLFAGIVRAPMTSVFMIFEITQDYQILVPLMVANMLSFAISKRYQPVPVYHALLQQDVDHPIDVVLDRFAQSAGILPVVSRADAHRVEGVVTIDSILKLAERQARAQASPPLAVATGPADQGVRSII